MPYNNYKYADNMRLNLMLPSYIIQNSLDKKGFSSTTGGFFSCPVCQQKMALFWNDKVSPARYGIRAFHCNHYGYNSEYPNDASGILLGLSAKDPSSLENLKWAKEAILGPTENNIDNSEALKKKQAEEKKIHNRVQMNMDIVKSKTHWAGDMGNSGSSLFLSRGIDVSRLDEDIRQRLGYLENERLYYLDPEKQMYDKPVFAVEFALGDKDSYTGYQGRRVRGESFESNKKFRFLNVGESNLFLPEKLSLISDEGYEKALFITEGPFDALSYYMAGGVALSLQGAGNLDRLIRRLSDILESSDPKALIVIDFDYDQAGDDFSANLISVLQQKSKNAIIVRHPGFYINVKDCNEALQHYPRALAYQVSVINELARQYKRSLVTKKVAQAWFETMKENFDWKNNIVRLLRTNKNITEKYNEKEEELPPGYYSDDEIPAEEEEQEEEYYIEN